MDKAARTLSTLKYRIVREQANKALDQYLQKIRKYAQNMPDTALPPSTASNGAPSTTTPRMGTPANEPSSWTGWAISSFTNKTSNAQGQIEAKPNGIAKQSNPNGTPQLFPEFSCGVCLNILTYLFTYVRYRNGRDENLLGYTYLCPRLEVLRKEFAQGMV